MESCATVDDTFCGVPGNAREDGGSDRSRGQASFGRRDYCEIYHSPLVIPYFLPDEFRQIRNHCLTMNTKHKLMIGTIWIDGIMGFQRIGEEPGIFLLTKKCDHDLCLLACGDLAECPEFCCGWPSVTDQGLCSHREINLQSWAPFKNAERTDDRWQTADVLAQRVPERESVSLCFILGKDIDSEVMNRLTIGTHMMRKIGYLCQFGDGSALSAVSCLPSTLANLVK